jgi:hypothetical protein
VVSMQAITKMMDPSISSTTILCIMPVHYAAVTAPQLSESSTVLRRNLQLADSPNKKTAAHFQRCVQRQIYNVRKQLTRKQLDGVKLGDSFGALTSFFEKNVYRELVAKHNDPADSYHPPPANGSTSSSSAAK